jgi:uncharacterized protein YkwD
MRSLPPRLRPFSGLTLCLFLVLAGPGCDDAPDGPLAQLVGGDGIAGLTRGVSVVPEEAAGWSEELLDLINDFRTERGLWPVTQDAVLSQIAGDYAQRMIEDGFFGHVHPQTGSTVGARAEQAGYEFWKVGENLAAGHISPRQVFDAWRSSPAHEANLLDPEWQDVGIGIRAGGSYGLYFVAEFGWPQE